MTIAGWCLMIASIGFVTAFFGWCLYKVLATPQATEHIHGQVDIDTHDHD